MIFALVFSDTSFTDLIELFLRSAFVDNLALAYFLGMCTFLAVSKNCLLYTSPSPRDRTRSRMPSSA